MRDVMTALKEIDENNDGQLSFKEIKPIIV